MILLIMAAGMGSRFGGLKQIEPIGPSGEFLLDYSVYDAIKAGFDKVVFIIKEENYNIFRETVGKRIEGKIKVEYVFQKNDNVPSGVIVPETRIKPWGTSHAILSAKDVINEPFAVINADDFYGFEPYKKIKEFFDVNKNENEYLLIGYKTINTMSENGSVKRGVCTLDNNNYLHSLIESSIEIKNDKIIATPLDSNIKPFEVSKGSIVSMNMWGFKPSLFKYLESEINEFFEENKNDLEKCEFLIPNSIFNYIINNKITVKVENTNEKWYGVTYKEDKDKVKTAINEMIENGIYPYSLWK